MTTLDDQNEKSGSSPASKISKNISDPIYGDAIYYLSILRQADHALLALDLLHHQELQLLFLSMTGAQRTEIIGRLGRLKQNAGALCDEFSAIPISLSSFKMEPTTSPSSGEPTESRLWALPTTQCSCNTPSSQKLSKDSGI